MLLIGILISGMVVGALAQLILGRDGRGIDWTMALVAGIAGSFVGGLAVSLLARDGIELQPSGLIGSVAGAVLVTAIWKMMVHRQTASTDTPPARTKTNR